MKIDWGKCDVPTIMFYRPDVDIMDSKNRVDVIRKLKNKEGKSRYFLSKPPPEGKYNKLETGWRRNPLWKVGEEKKEEKKEDEEMINVMEEKIIEEKKDSWRKYMMKNWYLPLSGLLFILAFTVMWRELTAASTSVGAIYIVGGLFLLSSLLLIFLGTRSYYKYKK